MSPEEIEIAFYNTELRNFWSDWIITGKIGEGSFGKVFRAKKSESKSDFASAIKVIRIPQNSSEIDSVKNDLGLDDKSVTTYFKELVDECVNEINLMESFRGTQNIVSIEDYKVISDQNEIGWYIYIRMELLKNFSEHIKSITLDENEVIKLGIDICNALKLCAKKKVIHRDIKPENIFVNSFGAYKLGDFGIAKKLGKTMNVMSVKGTYNYMAPEVYNEKKDYDYTCDIYSLGIILYKLMNGNRLPFINPGNETVSYKQMQEAFDMRISGHPLPKPLYASEKLSSIILKACAYNPSDRFSDAEAFEKALNQLQSEKYSETVKIKPHTDAIQTETLAFDESSKNDVPPPVPDSPPTEYSVQNDAPPPTKKIKNDNFLPFAKTVPQKIPLADINDTDELPNDAKEENFTEISPQKKHSGIKKFLCIIFALLIIILITVPCITFFSNTKPESDSENNTQNEYFVPDVIGKHHTDAEETLNELGFTVNKVYLYNSECKKGYVYFQHPSEGSSSYDYSIVTISISKGPVPND